MLQTILVVHGHIQELFLIIKFLKQVQKMHTVVILISPTQSDSKMPEICVVAMKPLTQWVTVTVPDGQKAQHSERSSILPKEKPIGLRTSKMPGGSLPKIIMPASTTKARWKQ